MKLILKNVKIYGFDPEAHRTFDNDGKITKQYNVPLYISEEDKNLIDRYIFGKTSKNDKGEFVFYGKSKTPIPFFNADGKKIKETINEVFLADVSILIDEFKDEHEENIRYSKCLGIKYVSKVKNEAPKMPPKTYDTYDDIFNGDDAIESTSENKPSLPPIIPDLPWDANGNIADQASTDDLPF